MILLAPAPNFLLTSVHLVAAESVLVFTGLLLLSPEKKNLDFFTKILLSTGHSKETEMSGYNCWGMICGISCCMPEKGGSYHLSVVIVSGGNREGWAWKD